MYYDGCYYCDFFSGSFGVLDEEALPPELLGGVELGVELELLPPLVPPPEAEPDVDLSFDGSVALGEDEDEDEEPGVAVEPVGAGVVELPPEGELDEDELEPELEGGGVVLLLELPLVPLEPLVLPVPLSWPQAARPKAMATAIASVENFMSPPWLVCSERVQQSSGRA